MNSEHVSHLQRMANESWRGSPEHSALTAALASLSAPQPPADPFVCTGDEIRCYDGNGCECAMQGKQPPAEAQPVGEAGTMPGTNGGFTTAVFKAADVPVGTKLYTAPPSAPVGEVRAAIQRDIDDHGVAEIRQAELDALTAPSAPVGVEGLVSRAISQGKRLQWSAVMDTLERLRGALALAQQPAAAAPVGVEGHEAIAEHCARAVAKLRGRESIHAPTYNAAKRGALTALKTVAALAQQPAAVDDAIRRDADRYRWLRLHANTEWEAETVLHVVQAGGRTLDLRIDEALAAQPGGSDNDR